MVIAKHLWYDVLMDSCERDLRLAGALAVVALVLSAAGLTITLIAAAYPPVSQYLSDAQNAGELQRVSWMRISPAFMLCFALWSIAEIICRRPLSLSAGRARQWTDQPPRSMTAMVILTAFIAAACVLGGRAAIQSIALGINRPITDNAAFSGLGLGLGLMAFPFLMLGSVFFHRWWWGVRAQHERGVVQAV